MRARDRDGIVDCLNRFVLSDQELWKGESGKFICRRSARFWMPRHAGAQMHNLNRLHRARD